MTVFRQQFTPLLEPILDDISNDKSYRRKENVGMRFYDKVKTLTAQSRISANVLAALPFGMGGLTYFLNPDYLEPLLSTDFGQKISMVGVVMVVLGFTVCRRMARIEI